MPEVKFNFLKYFFEKILDGIKNRLGGKEKSWHTALDFDAVVRCKQAQKKCDHFLVGWKIGRFFEIAGIFFNKSDICEENKCFYLPSLEEAAIQVDRT